MNETTILPPRRASLAVLLSFLGAGIGHVYAGYGRRGAVLLALSFVWAPFTLVLSLATPAPWVLYALFGVVVFTGGVSLFALIDAARVASTAAGPYAPRVYNRLGLYLALAALNVLWFFGAAAVVRHAAFEAFKIPTVSMSPTVRRDDRILVNKRVGTLRRGDLIVFAVPGRPNATFFKRVVGLPGETLEFRDGLVHVDGRPLANTKADGDGVYEERAGARAYRIFRAQDGTVGAPATVPAGHVFVLGDHRRNSFDSRRMGPIPLAAVRGLAQYVFYPDPRLLR